MANNYKSGLGRGLNSLMGGEKFSNEKFNEDSIISNDNQKDDIATFDGEVKIRKVKKAKSEDNNKPTSEKDNNTKKDINNTLELPLEKITTNPNQPRKKFNEQELIELSDSIKRNGLIQPIVVTKNKDKYEIIAGERRYRACKLAGFKSVPAIIRDTPENKILEIALIENIQREDLNPMEEAYCYKEILDKQEISHAELAELVSKGRSTITNSLRLLDLPENAQKYLYDNKISAGHARTILSVPTESGKNTLADKIVKEGLSVREAENIANLLKGQTKALKTVRPSTPKSFKRATNLLKEYLDTNAKVKKTKSKNVIEIDFKDESDLERLLNLIMPKN